MITRMMYALVLIAGILGVSGVAHADQVKTFTWTPPTQYTDGAPLPGSAIAQYTITCTGSGGATFNATASATMATHVHSRNLLLHDCDRVDTSRGRHVE